MRLRPLLEQSKPFIAALIVAIILTAFIVRWGVLMGGSDAPSKSGHRPKSNEMQSPKKSDRNLEPGGSVYREVRLENQPEISGEEDAEELLESLKTALGLGALSTLEIEYHTEDGRGNEYFQLQQRFKGIPVLLATSLLEVEDGRAISVSGTWQQDLAVETEPQHTPEQAITLAFEKLGPSRIIDFQIIEESELVIVIRAANSHLSWKTSISYPNGNNPTELVIVDAISPQFLFRIQQRHHQEQE